MTLAELEAREQIRELVARYSAYVDAARTEELLGLFHHDGQLEVDGRVLQGRDAMRRFLEEMVASYGSYAGEMTLVPTRHHTSNLQIDLEGSASARGRCYYQVISGIGLDHWGRYVDVYDVVGRQWRIRSRREILEGTVPGGWAAAASAFGTR
jgi:3-phenylpropionate/cinnamic acid dioxygenase small subunit